MPEPLPPTIPAARQPGRFRRTLRSCFRWVFRFSLRRVFAGVTAIAILFGIWAALLESYASQRRAAAQIARLCDGSELIDDPDPDRDGWTSADGAFRVQFLQDCHELPLATLLAYKVAYVVPGGLHVCPPRAFDFPWAVAIFDTMESDGSNRVATVPLKKVLGELSKLTSLREIVIASDSFTDDDFAIFQDFEYLDSMHVRSSNISAKCIDSLAALPNLTYVGLDFGYGGPSSVANREQIIRPATDAPPIRLSTFGFNKLAANRKLDALAIWYAPISDEDASAIAAMPIRCLRLGNVAITDAGFRAICANPATRELCLIDRYDDMLTRERLEIVARHHSGELEIRWPDCEPGMLEPFSGRTAINSFNVDLGTLSDGDVDVLVQTTIGHVNLNDTPIRPGQWLKLTARYPAAPPFANLTGGTVVATPLGEEAETD